MFFFLVFVMRLNKKPSELSFNGMSIDWIVDRNTGLIVPSMPYKSEIID